MSQLKLSPYIEKSFKNNKHFVIDRRTGDRYVISADEWAILEKVKPIISTERILGNYQGTSLQIKTMTLIQKLVYMGAFISTDDYVVKENYPFMPSKMPGMFGVETHGFYSDSHPSVAFLGLPWDFRYGMRGATLGPEVLRSASQHYRYALSKDKKSMLGWYSYRNSKEILKGIEIIDLGNVAAPYITDYESLRPVIVECVRQIAKLNTFPIFIGGEHGLTYQILQAIGIETFALIHIDAHDDYNKMPALNHGTYLRYAAKLNNLQSIHMIGLRGVAPVERGKELKDSGIHFLTAEKWRGGHTFEFLDRLPDIPLYISLDIDVIDPAYAPATKTVRGGGVTPGELMEFLKILATRHKIIALDLMEVSTPKSQRDYTAHYIIEILLHFINDIFLSDNACHIIAKNNF